MKKAKVYLTNGDVADVSLSYDSHHSWLNDIMGRGITTADSFFPYHSIVYILFEDEITTGKKSELLTDVADLVSVVENNGEADRTNDRERMYNA